MANSSIIDYVKKSLSENKTEADIRENLIHAGWDEKSVNEGFNSIGNSVPTPPSDVPHPPKAAAYSSAWDAFEHILLFLSLYTMATSFGIILGQFVDKWLPGINEYGALSALTDYLLQGAIASLIVTLPLFIFFHLDVNKRTLKNPQLRNLKVRRVFIYITLFYTFIDMVYTLITTIFTYLKGNGGANFILHTLIALLITGTIFAYYLHQVKEDRKIHV